MPEKLSVARARSESKSPDARERKRQSLDGRSSPNPDNERNLFKLSNPNSPDHRSDNKSGEGTSSGAEKEEQRYILFQTYPNDNVNKMATLEISPEARLQQRLGEWQTKINESAAFITTADKALTASDKRVADLKEWDKQAHLQKQISEWKTAHPGVQGPDPGTIYYDINVAKRTKINVMTHGEEFDAEINRIESEIVDALKSHNFPLETDYHDLQPDIADIDNNGSLTQEFDRLKKDLSNRGFAAMRDGLLAEAEHQIDLINVQLFSEWFVADTEYQLLEGKRPQHPFFPNAGSLSAKAEIEVIPRGELTGGGLVHTIRTLLQARNVDVTEEHVFETLGVHPHGGGVNIQQLNTALSELGGENKLQYWKIEPKHLKTVLEYGSMGILLDTDHIGNVPYDRRFQHAVTLERTVEDPITKERQIVVHDELVQVAVDDESTHNELVQVAVDNESTHDELVQDVVDDESSTASDAGGLNDFIELFNRFNESSIEPADSDFTSFLNRFNDESRTAPYPINFDSLAERGWERGWNGGAILSQDAINAIEQL